jgi:hypothetical protein
MTTVLKYVDQLGLKDPNMIVVSSGHYYYSEEEMKNVKTIVNAKELNRMGQVNDILYQMSRLLPMGSSFIGCFIDGKRQNRFSSRYSSLNDVENGIVSKRPFMNRVYNKLDSVTNNYMAKEDIISLFQSYGFTVMDTSEIDGITYFHSIKTHIMSKGRRFGKKIPN